MSAYPYLVLSLSVSLDILCLDMIRHCVVHQRKIFLINLLTIDEDVLKTKTNVLQSNILLQVIVDSVAGGDNSDEFI